MKFNTILFSLILFSFILETEAQQIPPHLDCVKINHLAREACHNCYISTPTTLTFKQALDLTRVVELDIHSHKRTTSEAPIGVWYVRHSSQGTNPNNLNNCISQFNGQSNQDFNICLENVQQWSLSNPGHDPIIVFIDLKGPNVAGGGDFWRPDHATTDLDNVLKQFAMDMSGSTSLDPVYKPSDLQGGFSQLRFAAQNENWPSLGNLKNKFMFVLTGENEVLDEYLTNVGLGAMAFVAVRVSSFISPLDDSDFIFPIDISFFNLKQVVFYNLEDDQTAASTNFIPSNGYMSRSWQGGGASTSGYYGGSIAANINNIAITNIGSNILPPMNRQLIGINNITVSGTQQSPVFIDSYYDNILQHALIKVTTQNLIVNSGTTYNLRAGQEVNLKAGTVIKSGATTNISIGNCADYANNLRINPNIDEDGRLLSQKEMEQLHLQEERKNNVIQIIEDKKPILYPNPAKEVVYIDYSNGINNPAIFTLYDLTGRVVLSKNYQPQNEGSQTFSLNINNLKEGTYFYTLQVGEQTYNGKVVKIN